MKKIIEISAMGLAIAALAVSCAKEMNTNSTEATETLSITATLGEEQDGEKTVLYGGLAKVCFLSTDKLFVFGNNGGTIEGYQFSPNEATKTGRTTSKVFECASWPAGATPLYAVATTDPASNVCTAEGHITLNVSNAVQKLDWSKSYASHTCTHVGKVEGSEVKQLKNVCALIGFTLSDQKDDIVSISVTHSGSDAVHFGGLVKVDCSADDPVPTVESYVTPTDEILVTVADKFDNKTYESDNIPVNMQFYLSVLPGEYHDVKFTMVDSQGWVATRTFSRIKVARSTVLNLPTALNCDKDGNVLTFTDPKDLPMPDELVFKLGKEWNFVESPKSADEQAPEGDEYTYDYVDAVTGYTGQFPFVFGGGYTYQATEMQLLNKNESYFILPAIEGRILKSVSITHRNTGGRSFTVLTLDGTSTLASISIPAGSKESPQTGVAIMDNALENTGYKVLSGSSSFFCTDITVTYTKPAPMPETLVMTLDFSGGNNPFNETLLSEDSQKSDGDSYTYTYTKDDYTHNFEFVLCKNVNKNKYENNGSYLEFSRISNPDGGYYEQLGYIMFPAVEGRYLSKVTINQNALALTGYILNCVPESKNDKTDANKLVKSFSVAQSADSSVEFSQGETAVSTSYYYTRNKEAAMRFTTLTLTYSTPE